MFKMLAKIKRKNIRDYYEKLKSRNENFEKDKLISP